MPVITTSLELIKLIQHEIKGFLAQKNAPTILTGTMFHILENPKEALNRSANAMRKEKRYESPVVEPLVERQSCA